MSNPIEAGSTLEQLKLVDVGPAKEFDLNFGPRINTITGDNGLGKTFLLDCVWWAMTGTWAGYTATPNLDSSVDAPIISFQLHKEGQRGQHRATYDWARQTWSITPTPSLLPGLALYSQADGSYAVWDPAKHIFSLENSLYDKNVKPAVPFLHFTRNDIWDGIEVRDTNGNLERILCNGLIRDWVSWQRSNEARFDEFCAVLKALSAHETETLLPGQPARLKVGDVREIPTVTLPSHKRRRASRHHRTIGLSPKRPYPRYVGARLTHRDNRSPKRPGACPPDYSLTWTCQDGDT